MTPTIDQLADGLMRRGYDDDDMYRTAEVESEVWEELQDREHVERADGGKPKLTAKGRKTFNEYGSRRRRAGIHLRGGRASPSRLIDLGSG
jgi:hypothetical protein